MMDHVPTEVEVEFETSTSITASGRLVTRSGAGSGITCTVFRDRTVHIDMRDIGSSTTLYLSTEDATRLATTILGVIHASEAEQS